MPSEYQLEQQRLKEIRDREAALKDAGYEKKRVAGGGSGEIKYVNVATGKSAGYAGAPIDLKKTAPTDYGKGADEIYSLKSMGGGEKAPSPTPAPTPSPTADTGGGGPSGGGGGPSGGGGGGAPTISAPTGESYKGYESKGIYSDKLEPVKPELAEVQIEGPRSQVIEERVKNLVDTNSPLFRAAAGQAYRQLASRGMANSSLANQAVMDAVLSVAVPIASADAETFKQQSVLNQGFSNEFRAAQNAAYYNQESQKLDGIIREVLANISGEYSVKTAQISAEASMYATDVSAAIASEENRIKAAEVIANQETETGAKTTADLIYNKTPNATASNFASWYKTQ
jgi:hypothetical protein